MNKYSSKAVKTAATVGMSLAMVLSAATPVLADKLGNSADVITVLNGILTASDTDIKSVALDAKADWDGVANELDATATLADYVTAYKAELEQAADVYGNEDAIHLVGKSGSGRKTIIEKVGKLTTALNELKTWGEAGEKELTETSYGTLKPHYDTIVDYYADYKGNLETGNVSLKDKYDLYFNSFEDAVKEYQDSQIGDFVDDFLNNAGAEETKKGLNKTTIYDGGITVGDLLDGGKFDRAKLSELEKFIKDVKEDKKSFGKNSIKYSAVKDDEEVQDVIDGLETVVEEIKEVNELLKSTGTTVKNYKSLSKKVASLSDTAGKYDAKDDDKVEKYETAVNAFRSGDIADLAAYVDDVVSEFYSVEVVKRSNGNYSLRLKEEDYARYLAKKTDVVSTDLEKILTTNLEKDDSESVYEALVGNKTDLEKLVAAVTTDIEGITVTTNLTSAQASKIIAAKKALDSLYDTDKKEFEEAYVDALTSKEKKAIKANATLIETLYLKLILNGTVTQSGWVDKGNGDWDYIAEDGTRPSKWIASGANWYYVKNGTMLRNSWIASDAQGTRWYYVDDNGVMVSNTTVNGYTFNSYGVWVKQLTKTTNT